MKFALSTVVGLICLAAPSTGYATDILSAPANTPSPLLSPLPAARQAEWTGLSIDIGLLRPLNSTVKIFDPSDTFISTSNLTGIHLTATGSYLFQQGRFVLGPRIKVSGGIIEAMPSDFTVRTNAMAALGGEGGLTIDGWYGYLFVGGGFAWTSASKIGIGTQDNFVSMWEAGAGLRVRLLGQWYGKAEISYVTLGDQRLGAYYFDPKPYIQLNAGFGYQF